MILYQGISKIKYGHITFFEGTIIGLIWPNKKIFLREINKIKRDIFIHTKDSSKKYQSFITFKFHPQT